jgi:hypothetical protein
VLGRAFQVACRICRVDLDFLVDRDPKRLQKALILGGESHLAKGRNFRGLSGSGLAAPFAVLSFIEANRSLKNQKHVVASTFNFPDRFGDALRVGKRFVDRISQILH